MTIDASIRIGNVTGAIYQSSRPIRMNADGSGDATLTYKCAAQSQVVTLPAYLTPHPYVAKLLCFEASLDREPGGIYVITATYKGVLADNAAGLAQYDSARTTSEAPIETHPLFAYPPDAPPVTPNDLALIELTLQKNQPFLPVIIPLAANPKADLLFAKKRRGIESYLKIGSTFKKTYVSETIPTGALMGYVGKIVNAPDPAPAPPEGQDYLLSGVSWTKQAGVVRITEEYLLSGVGGWDHDLYDKAGAAGAQFGAIGGLTTGGLVGKNFGGLV